MSERIAKHALDIIFLEARTLWKWEDKTVDDELLQDIFDIAKMGPTSANNSPLRILFVSSSQAKERLKPHLMKGNVDKTMSAPVTAIFADDLAFYQHLPRLHPYSDMKSSFEGEGKDKKIERTAFRNATLQAAYFMIAARAKGLDCGPMSGFDSHGVDREFFAQTTYKSNFLCNLGYGDWSGMRARAPRFHFDEVCQIL